MDTTVMSKIGCGLYVLTARKNERDNGCIINTVMQLTSSPLRLEIVVNKANYTHDIIVDTGLFNVSVITESAPFELFERFGFVSGRTKNKFVGYTSYKRSDNGVTYITEGVNAYISAKVTDSLDVGTHTVFIADVTDSCVLSDAPSATYDYYHKNIKPVSEIHNQHGWRCKICGYVYDGALLPDDYICPLCKHGAADFEKIDI